MTIICGREYVLCKAEMALEREEMVEIVTPERVLRASDQSSPLAARIGGVYTLLRIDWGE